MSKSYSRRPNISLRSYPSGIIRLSISLLEALDYPKYIRVLINPETKELGFQPSNKDDVKALKVLYTERSDTHGANICSKLSVDRIYESVGFIDGHSYNCRDCYKSNDGIFVFKLAAAKDVTRYIHEK